jgi:MoxR-like ATPase
MPAHSSRNWCRERTVITEETTPASVQLVQSLTERVVDNIKRVIVGKDDVVRLTMIAVISQGHILIEDVPGVGKTVLTKAIARSIGCTFKRIQFTPDLLPSDVTGVSIFSQKTGNFEYRPGPLFSQFVLADEINRATPKTQSALLEAMEEGQITVDGATYILPKPFLVMATQNPIEYEGTFPLPEAQLDRFLMNISLGYPGASDEVNVLERQQYHHPLESLQQVITDMELVQMQEAVRAISVKREIAQYIVDLVAATRNHPNSYLGASPRGSLALYRTSQVLAAMRGRDHVRPEDVKTLIRATLSHRIIVAPAARVRGVTSGQILDEVVGQVAAPDSPANVRR